MNEQTNQRIHVKENAMRSIWRIALVAGGCMCVPNASMGAVIAASHFETGTDGWWAAGDPISSLPSWSPSGYIQTVDGQYGVKNS